MWYLLVGSVGDLYLATAKDRYKASVAVASGI